MIGEAFVTGFAVQFLEKIRKAGYLVKGFRKVLV